MLLEGSLRCILCRMNHHNMWADLVRRFLLEEFDWTQCKFCQSEPQQRRRPSKIRTWIGLWFIWWTGNWAIGKRRKIQWEWYSKVKATWWEVVDFGEWKWLCQASILFARWFFLESINCDLQPNYSDESWLRWWLGPDRGEYCLKYRWLRSWGEQ